MGVLNVSGQIGQKCKSESAGKHSPCSAKHYFGAAQQIGHYTDWTEQIAINNGTLSKQPLFPNPLLLPLHALPVSSSLFLFSLSVSVLVAFLTSVQVLENSSSNVERNVKQQDQTSHPRERWKKRGEEKGGREKRMGGEEAVGGESQTLQQEKTTGIWLFSPSPPPLIAAQRDLCHHTWEGQQPYSKGKYYGFELTLTSHNESPKCSRPSPLCAKNTIQSVSEGFDQNMLKETYPRQWRYDLMHHTTFQIVKAAWSEILQMTFDAGVTGELT